MKKSLYVREQTVNPKKKINLWTIVLLVSLFVFACLMIAGNAVIIADKFGAINIYLKYAFYALILFIFIVGIVYPMASVFISPVFSLRMLRDKNGIPRKRWCKKLAANLKQNVELTEDETKVIDEAFSKGDLTDDELIAFCKQKFSKAIDNQAKETAKQVFLLTAISQNPVYDMLAIASANYSLIKSIVETCGFRPNNAQIIRLYIKISFMTIIAGGLEGINIEQYIPELLKSALGKILNLAIASTTQGSFNAFTTLRIAMMTKNYLLSEEDLTIKELSKKSTLEAAALLNPLRALLIKSKDLFVNVKHWFTQKKQLPDDSNT